MEAEVKQVIKEKEYVHDENHDKYASKGLAGTALGFGIGGAVLGAAALWGRRGGIGGGMPENVITCYMLANYFPIACDRPFP